MSYRLLTRRTAHGPRAALLIGERVFDAQEATGNAQHAAMLGVLDNWAEADARFAALAQDAGRLRGGQLVSEVELLAPILYPGQIFAAGANYQDHIDEMKKGTEFKAQNARTVGGGRPWHFVKPSRGAVIGHDTIRPLPPYSRKVDWEIELAVVIGKAATRISAANALEYVAGYTIANDLSARDFVVRDGIAADSPFRFDWISHKGFDGACPLGPWITPARSIADPQALGLKLWVDDVLMQDSSTRYMIFSIAEQIEELSARVTLYPGDVILTGTPAGVGMTRNVFLQSGQKLRLWIEHIGELRHGFN
jgi:2-keto-4-pentenoate hydratase/2-oxohepta-3-ene-1,7-dioic acid hydratase in catechol pathway